MELQVTRGVLGLVGEAIDTIANKSLNNQSLGHTNEPTLTRLGHHHITLISKEELEAMDKAKWANSTVDTERLYPLGLGGGAKDASLFVVVVWAAGQQFRRQLGLPPMHFHITLSDRPHDDFVTDKSIDSLLPGQFPSSPSPELLDHIIFTLIAFNGFDKASSFCVQLIQATLDSYRGFLRYADVTYRIGKYKLSMLAYACAFQRTDDDKVRKYCIKRIVQCSAYTEWGGLLTHDESLHIPGDIFHSIIAPWTDDLRYCLNEMIIKPTLCLDSRERLYLPNGQTKTIFQKLPRFFRWLIPFYLAIMSTPRNESDISMLASPHLSIRRILTLTEEEPLPKAWFSGKNIKHTYLPIPNYHPPSIEQMDLVMRLFEEEDSSPMLIHCGGGKGRAGTIAACYLVAYGFGKPCGNLTQPTMSASDAIGALRAIRPGSIETPQQEAFVSKWSSTIWKRRCVVPPLVIEPAACSLAVEGEFLPDSADLFVLVGLPGSGKSYFSRALMARCGRGWAYVSQDESGSRAFSETQLGRASGRVILDRCNTSFHDRRTWLKLASWSVSPVCILFDYDADLCISRAQNRANHPTLPPGSRVRNAVDQMKREFVQPTLAEGFKAIVTVRSFAASHELVMLISPPVLLFKYPRTPHLLDLGAATDDDIISNTNLPDGVNGHIVITEKVDGANMGISLSADRQILVQNRAHYVNTSTHEQFKKLGIWLDRHREDVYKILHRDELYPERFILFGEWMSAIHSIEYTNLPDRFLAFDFFDRRTEAFADRNSLSRILSSTSIQMVPVILEGRMPGDDELRNMIQKQSSYCEGRMEGVYLKLERDGRVVTRGKIVRGDFIPGNEHWTRGHLRTNGIKADDF